MQKEMKAIWLLIVAFICFVFAILSILILWGTKDSKSKIIYNEYSQEETYEYFKSEYSKEISNLLMLKKYNQIYDEYLNKEYISKNNLTKESFNEFLSSNGYYSNKIEALEYVVYKEQNNVIYVISFRINNEINEITVIEEKPYQYTVSFSEESYLLFTNTDYKKEYLDENLNLTVKKVNQTDKNIEYEVEITSISDVEKKIELSKITGIYLELEDNSKVYGEVNLKENINLSSTEDMIKFNITFYIDISKQVVLESLVFDNIHVEEESKQIKIQI